MYEFAFMTIILMPGRSLSLLFTTALIFQILFSTSNCAFAQLGGYRLTDSVIAKAAVRDIAYTDMDANGSPDIIFLEKGKNDLSICYTDGKGHFTHKAFISTQIRPSAFCIIQANQDLRPDIALINPSGHIQLMLNEGNGKFTQTSEWQIGVMASDIQASDLNRDGFEDLIVSAVSENKLNIFWGSRNNLMDSLSFLPCIPAPQLLSVIDYNEDGWPDIIVSADQLALYINNGKAPFDFVGQASMELGNGLSLFEMASNAPQSEKGATIDQLFLQRDDRSIWLMIRDTQADLNTNPVSISSIKSIKESSSILLDTALYYHSGKADLTQQAVETLKQIKTMLLRHPSARLIISSHTDSDDSFRTNLHLSALRTHHVLVYLQQNGIASQRLIGRAYGEAQPRVPNISASNKQLNRRTELRIIDRGSYR